jgi:energy-coupling factor transporter ATP-binding protein EcfA2
MSSSRGNSFSNNRYASDVAKTDWGKGVSNIGRALFKGSYGIIEELSYGLRSKTIPWNICFVAGTIFAVLISRHWDLAILNKTHLTWFYPSRRWSFWAYRFSALVSPWIVWAIWQLALRQQMLRKLTEACLNAGLKTPMDRLPSFICDHPIDSETRKLKLYAAGISIQQFRKAKDTLQSNLQVYIDDIKDDIRSGTVEIIYAQNPIPESATLENIRAIPAWTFMVGKTRANWLSVDLRKVPHLLVAGQTGGGKSTFLRQFITTLYLNNAASEFHLIDLKGGLEFQLFEGLDRVKVASNITEAVDLLKRAAAQVKKRMELLKESKSKDLEAYGRIGILRRRIIVVDEAAEMFLAGAHAGPGEVQTAKRILSQIARQGRSVGVHLVVATQRPDSHAVDPQVKANLPGVLCYPMANDASSMTVLGNGRATDLKMIPGRALWKAGTDITEIQTPFLPPSEVEELLKEFRKVSPKLEAEE